MTLALDQLRPPPDVSMYRPLRFITVTTACQFARCPHLWFQRNGCGHAPQTKHPALGFGEAIHVALPQVREKGLAAGAQAFSGAWDGQEDSTGKRTPMTAYNMLADFARTHEKAIYELETPPSSAPSIVEVTKKISDYEIPFALDIGLPVPFVGRIDSWGRHRDTRKKWVIEYKTTSEMGDRFTNGFRLNPQGLGYTLAGSALGESCEGCIFDAVLVAKTKVGSLTHPMHVQQHQLQWFLSWLRETTHRLLAMEKRFLEEGVDFLRQVSGCTTYPEHGQPGYLCDFIHMCEAPDWRHLRGFFKIDYHEPFKLKDITETPQVSQEAIDAPQT